MVSELSFLGVLNGAMAEGTRSKSSMADERLAAHDFKLKEIAEAITVSTDGVNLRFGAVDTRLTKLEHSLEEIKLLLEPRGFTTAKAAC